MSETTLRDHLGGSKRIWQGALRLARSWPGIDPEEREQYAELYEHEIARERGEGVSREDCERIRARLEAWVILRRTVPTRMPPVESGFGLYCSVRQRLVDYRRGHGERVPPSELESAQRLGRDVFLRWYNPIQDDLSAIERAVAKLARFGTADDAAEIARLNERGDGIAKWLRYQQQSGIVPWLPEHSLEVRGIDEWWRGNVKRKTHSSVCAWWEQQRAEGEGRDG